MLYIKFIYKNLYIKISGGGMLITRRFIFKHNARHLNKKM